MHVCVGILHGSSMQGVCAHHHPVWTDEVWCSTRVMCKRDDVVKWLTAVADAQCALGCVVKGFGRCLLLTQQQAVAYIA